MDQLRFQAVWTSYNSHLHNFFGIVTSTHLSAWEKITTLFHRIIESITRTICPTFILNKAKVKILPITQITTATLEAERADWANKWDGIYRGRMNAREISDLRKMRQAYKAHQLKLQTPDGVEFEGFYYQHTGKTDRNIPTIICFNPSDALATDPIWDWLLLTGSRCIEPFNVLMFDYPSQGVKCSEDLVAYGETLYQCGQGLGVSEHNLHFLGYGFGATIAAAVLDMHPDAGRMVSLRSFASMESYIWNEADRSVAQGAGVPIYIKWLIGKFNNLIGWGLEATDAMWKLRNKTLFLYSRHDKTIPPHIHAMKAIGERNIPQDQCVEMHLKFAMDHKTRNDHKFLPPCYTDLRNNPIDNRIVNFILGSHVLKSEGDDGFRSRESRGRQLIDDDKPIGGSVKSYRRALWEDYPDGKETPPATPSVVRTDASQLGGEELNHFKLPVPSYRRGLFDEI